MVLTLKPSAENVLKEMTETIKILQVFNMKETWSYQFIQMAVVIVKVIQKDVMEYVTQEWL